MSRPTNKQIGWGIVAVAAILATLFFGVNYPVPPAPVEPEPGIDVVGELESRSLSRPVQLRDVKILQNLDVDGDATVGDDLTVTDDLSAADVTISGGLEVTGGVTGPLALTGPTAVATATPAFYVNNLGAANNSFEVRDAATPVFVVTNGGYVLARGNYLPKTAGYTITAADSGSTIRTTNAITLTLPGAAAGLQYCIVNGDGNDLVLDPPDGTDYVLVLSNSGGDRVTNTTVGDFLCLFGIDATNWVALSRQGTWADGN